MLDQTWTILRYCGSGGSGWLCGLAGVFLMGCVLVACAILGRPERLFRRPPRALWRRWFVLFAGVLMCAEAGYLLGIMWGWGREQALTACIWQFNGSCHVSPMWTDRWSHGCWKRFPINLASDFRWYSNRVDRVDGDSNFNLAGAMPYLAQLSHLRELNLTGCKLSDKEMAGIEQLKRLRTLILAATDISDEGLRPVGELTALRELSLGLTNVSGSGLRHLHRLTELRSLDMGPFHVTDDATPHLLQFPHLRNLFLFGTDITDRSVPYLIQLRELETLNVAETQITAKGIAELRRAMPRRVAIMPDGAAGFDGSATSESNK